ncbi:glycoside hydrolase family 2 TIM barrel-domain containing protein [Neptunicella sp.]|uniref:glycoside hydrolase family 2 TIM barrel-domain containing protein n=1 Tax=Neptunicella sp. TaxID=2125986 RepID=UPI003F69162C
MLKQSFISAIGLILISLLGGCQVDSTQKIAQQLQPSATEINLNRDWQFSKTHPQTGLAELEQQHWQNVRLPHTPQIEPKVVNDQWQGVAWYKKTLSIQPGLQGKKLWLRFEAAMNRADIWLNGNKIGQHQGGYLPFTLDISDSVKVGENKLLVRLDNRDNPVTGPKALKILDFNTYGGLYRGVNLLVRDPLHISDEMLADKTASGGVFVTFPKVDKTESQIQVNTHIQNQYVDGKTFELRQQLMADQQIVAQTSSGELKLAAGQDHQYSQLLTVASPRLWSPSSPNLYQLRTQLYLNGRLLQQQNTRIGIRQFAFNQQHELLINGEKTFLRGVNRHQEYPHVGYATSKQADYRDAVKIKSAGFDYVRLSHYPHSPAFMQAADELGLVLIDAILGWQYYSPAPEFRQHVLQTCRDMLRRDRNHASVLAWECSLNESDMPDDFIADLHQTVHQEYPHSYSAGWQHGFDVYLQARQHRLKHYETPQQPYNVSEYGDWEYYAQNAGLNQDSWGDLKQDERTSRQLLSDGEARLLQQARNIKEAHNDNLAIPAFADGYWVMFDYNRGYADDIEASGIMSLYRLPKYSYYFYQSQRDANVQSTQFDSGPMVYIASEWTAESTPLVTVFSNADEVELRLNGQLVARQTPQQDALSTHLNHPPFIFNVGQFKAGTLEATAFINGKQVAQHQVSTPGQVSGITLSMDTSGIPAQAGVNDLVFVYAQLVDSKGNLVPLNQQQIEFSSKGDIQIVNPDAVMTAQGKAAILVRIGDSLANASVTATSAKFKLTSAALPFEQSNSKKQQ